MIVRTSIFTFNSNNITILDVFNFAVERILKVEKYNKIPPKLLTPEKIGLYTENLLLSNQIKPEMSFVECENEYSKIHDSDFDDFFYKLFVEKEDFTPQSLNFKEDFYNEIFDIVNLLKRYSKEVIFNCSSDNPAYKIILYVFTKIFERLGGAIIRTEDSKVFLRGLFFIDSTSIPKNEDNLIDLIERNKFFKVSVSEINKIIEDTKPKDKDEKEFFQHYLYIPTVLDIETQINELSEKYKSVSSLIEEIKKHTASFKAFDILKAFFKQERIPEIVHAITNKDTYKPMVKEILNQYSDQVSVNHKAFKEAVEMKIEMCKQKQIPFSDWEIKIIKNVPYFFDKYLTEEDIHDKLSEEFNKVYQDAVNNFQMNTDDKLKHLQDILKSKEKISSIENIHKWRLSFNKFFEDETKVLHQLYNDNYFENEPISYFFIIYNSIKKNNYNLHHDIIKSYKENKYLRIFAIENLYMSLFDEQISESFKKEHIRREFREAFLHVTSEKDTINFRLEVFELLIKYLTGNDEPPYTEFFIELSDAYIQIMKKLFESSLNHLKSAHDENTMTEPEKNKTGYLHSFEVMKEILIKDYYHILVKALNTTEFQKDLIKRKIELRLGHEYREIEQQFKSHIEN